ncbi:hypothetical protein DL93DRAFT_1700177 [Clavulina sp. PMI_390]|nr:hypothetical protein DL93DRAFT_1700177 [Clavulina sp. PMI_390]
MLSNNEGYVARPPPGSRETIPPSQYGSLSSRRQSARPTNPPPLSVQSFGQSIGHPGDGGQSTHPFAQRQHQEMRPLEGYSLGPSDPAQQLQQQQHVPRQAHAYTSDSSAPHGARSGSSRRPMNPPLLHLPTESITSSSTTTAGSSRTSSSSAMSPSSPLSPPRSSQHRPSSRRALVAALSLAQDAVKLDTDGKDPQAAVDAYFRSVQLLREVMGRVSSGESASGTSRDPSRSLTPREEEVRRLKSIHDTYAERLEVLCNMYNIQISELAPPPPPIPVAPAGPTRTSSQEIVSATYQAQLRSSGRIPRTSDADATPFNSQALSSPERETPPTNILSAATTESSTPIPPLPSISSSSSITANRISSLPPQRPPPTGPPPPKPVPLASSRTDQQTPWSEPQSTSNSHPQLQNPTRDRAFSHRRGPSAEAHTDLEIVNENGERERDSLDARAVSRPGSVISAIRRSEASSNDDDTINPTSPSAAPPSSSAPISNIERGSSPTPLPSPSTPRAVGEQSQSKRGVSTGSQISTSTYDSITSSANTTGSSARSRGNTTSSASSWSDTGDMSAEKTAQQRVGPVQGSIAMRRKVNSGASATGVPPLPGSVPSFPPPLPGVSSSQVAAGPMSAAVGGSNRLTADSLPPSTLSSLGMTGGRSRAVSQPGRRPSNAAEPDARNAIPPLPPLMPLAGGTSSANSSSSSILPRKQSIPHNIGGSRLGGGTASNGINITVQTAVVFPATATTAVARRSAEPAC